MKLRRLVINNFRQFYGRHEIVIADEEKLNTTVIFGNNGSGKTTILNAFTWALYGEFTDAFSQQERLINKRAAVEAAEGAMVSCSVDLWYEHDEQEYRLVRESKVKVRGGEAKSTQRDNEVFLYSVIGEKREQRLRSEGKEAELDVTRILPKHLYNYFFFDGERIEKLVRTDKTKEVSEATKALVGVETIRRGIEDLNSAKKKLRQQYNAVEKDADSQRIVSEQEECDREIEECEGKLEEIESELSNQKKLKAEIDRAFESLRESQALVQRRKELIGLRDDLTARKTESLRELEILISGSGYLAFIREPVKKFRELLDGMRKRGELPAPIKSQFVKDLLEKGSCICGSELKHGSDGYQHVERWVTASPMADAEETALQMSARLERAESEIDGMWIQFDSKNSSIEETKKQISKVGNELEDISGKLRSDASQNIQSLQERLDDTESRIHSLSDRRAVEKKRLEDLKERASTLEGDFKKNQANEKTAQIAKRRLEATGDAIARMEKLKDLMGNQFRVQLEKKIQRIFGNILTALYIPKLTEEYELILVERTTAGKDLPVPASTGEGQVLSLSFIMAIIDCIKEWKERKALLGIDSSQFPMIMDSPFGSLDELYRRSIAKNIPKFAHQLMLLVSKTQWRGEVSEELTPRIGRKYVLVYHTPNQDAEIDDIELDGNHYPLVKKTDGYEFTEIIEI